jgi:heme oxygenase
MSILREYTNQHHRWVEEKPFVQYLLKGEITKEHYVMYLQQFFRVYSNLEYYSELSQLTQSLPDLKRSNHIIQDLNELGSIQLGPIYESTNKYRERILQLYYDNENRHKLMAHIYVRHMGDLYGGKLIMRKVPGSGKAYQFEDRPGLIKAIDSKLNVELVDEAIRAFELSGEIFDELWEKINV